MKKSEQLNINSQATEMLDKAITEWTDPTIKEKDRKINRLRTCSAMVYETENFYILKSYRTIIACIEKDTDTLCDCLRTVYGYTSTSAQHIAKFNHDYCGGKWGCENILRTYPI